MTSPCVNPGIIDDLLDAARPGAAPLGPEQLFHLEACESCRAAVERLRRLAGTWQGLEPTPVELRSARARFMLRGGKRRSPKVVPKAAALVIVLAAAAASAAVRVVVAHLVTPPAAPTASAGDPPPPALPSGKRWRPAGHRTTAPEAGVDNELPELAEAGVPAEPPAVAEISVDDLPVASPAPPVSAPHRAAPSAPAAAAPEAGAPPSPWTVAAAAMRAGDYVLAEAAFNELARSPEASTRDAARLARAQVWIAEGRDQEARPELRQLAADGATPLVRKRAEDALDALP